MDEKILQEYLSGNSIVSQRYRELEAGEVPAHLDERVLRQSRDAVASTPSVVSLEQSRLRQSRQRWLRWSVPATLAASTVLVLSIVIESGNQHQVTAPVLEKKDRAAESQPPAAMSDERRSRKAMPMRTQKSADVAAPAALPEGAQQVPGKDQEVTAPALRKRQSAQDAPVAAMAPPPQPSVLLPSTSATAPFVSNAAPPKAEESKAAAAQPMRSESAAAGAMASRESADTDLSEVLTGSNVDQLAQAGPRGTVAPSPSSFARADENPAEPGWRAQPETWLEHIRELRKDGSARAADGEWKKFRAAYPDYEVAETDLARSK